MEDTPTLTAEEKQDLAEAVAAEQAIQAVPAKAQALQAKLVEVHELIVDLCGRGAQGAEAYCRSKAIEKLEECGHRIGDAVNCIMSRQVAQDQAIAKAMADGNVVKFPGGQK